MTLYRKKPIAVDAVRLTDRIKIETREGIMVGDPGDWPLMSYIRYNRT